MRSLIYIEQSNTAKNTIELISKLLLHIVWAEYTEKGVIEYTVYVHTFFSSFSSFKLT